MAEQHFIPLFPLNIVVFPGENLNLHIFEPRYKQLVNDCLADDKRFGIPSYVKNQIKLGTEVEITDVVKIYDDGRMDIRTQAGRLFRVIDYQNPLVDKLYAGGLVEYIEVKDDASLEEKEELQALLGQLHELLKIPVSVDIGRPNCSYQLAHKIGLSKEQEYELLSHASEKQRIAYIRRHLKKTLPVIREFERSKEIIRMNGHFRRFDPTNF